MIEKRPSLPAPFPWFGGKSRAAPMIWERLGDVNNYVEPFFGSGAVLLGRPPSHHIKETVNDIDGFVANFWRAISLRPDETAQWADQPVNENDLHARHVWLVNAKDGLREKLEGDPDYCDPKVAGWWVWGICCWIGSGWCSGNGPWRSVDGQIVHLGDDGRGVNRQLVHLGNDGRGVNRQIVHLGDAGCGRLVPWFRALAARLRNVRVASGDWSRVCGASVTTNHPGVTGVVLDPPYADTAGRSADLYAEDSLSVAHAVREWAIANGNDPKMRIALCGYDGEHEMPASWEVVRWKTHGGYGLQDYKAGRDNAAREVVWFSPHCLGARQGRLAI